MKTKQNSITAKEKIQQKKLSLQKQNQTYNYYPYD